MMQATLRDAFAFEGIGLHTGEQAAIEVRPADRDEGISFVLGDTLVPAAIDYVCDTSRATVLGRDGASVSTTEHLLSALVGMGITNARIHVTGPEIPVGDGSAAGFVDAIVASGVETQPHPRPVLRLDEPLFVRAGEKMIVALPSPVFRVRFLADYPAPIGTQYFDGEIDAGSYRAGIAAARTFGFLHEVDVLWARGLARGGSLDNALVFTADGPLQPLRFPDEAVRHKVLDLIGDLALLGAWPQCEIIAVKSGHELHAAATRVLRDRAHVLSG
jgi:UDP-3-O-[3-hydroxymyristoyl] N-acetylglucosamine deacetylase